MNTAGTPSLSDLVIERVGFGLFVLDRAMNVLMWNRFMQDHSGTVAADVIGRNLFDCFPICRARGSSASSRACSSSAASRSARGSSGPTCFASSTTGRSPAASTTCSRTARSCRSRAAATSRPCA
jgi:hypothetical protein